MPSLNVICHGMMLFVERPFHIDILMPEVKEHEYMWGTVEANSDTCTQHLEDICPGVYALRGAGPAANPEKFSSSNCKQAFVLKGQKIDTIPELARVWLQIPRPNHIRTFNPFSVGSEVFGSVDQSVALNPVASVCDIVVFRYTDLRRDFHLRAVTEGGCVAKAFSEGCLVAEDCVFNLCLYAEEGSPTKIHNPTAGNNSLMHLAGTSKHPDFNLLNIDPDPPVCGFSPWGIDVCQFKRLDEILCAKDQNMATDKECAKGPIEFANHTGCSSHLVSR